MLGGHSQERDGPVVARRRLNNILLHRWFSVCYLLTFTSERTNNLLQGHLHKVSIFRRSFPSLLASGRDRKTLCRRERFSLGLHLSGEAVAN